MTIISSTLAALMFLSSGSDHGYNLPQCNETAVSGVWWPDVECARTEFRKTDSELNRVWKMVLKRQTAINRKNLVVKQRTWLKKMISDCSQSQSDDKEQQFIDYEILVCKENLTNKRINFLKKI